VYTVYTGKHDTSARLKNLLQGAGFKVAVLRATVSTESREDWILDQVERGIDVLVCNPELVKTGLDLLDFPTICFLQTGYSVYTVQQASRAILADWSETNGACAFSRLCRDGANRLPATDGQENCGQPVNLGGYAGYRPGGVEF
jgi:hypothetical protein